MLRYRVAVLVALISAGPATAQDKKELQPLARAIELQDKKVAEAQEEIPVRLDRLLQAAADAQSAAEGAFLEQYRAAEEAELIAQRLRLLQKSTGKGITKTLPAWIDLAQKLNAKWPVPTDPPLLQDFSAIDKHALATPIAETESIKRLTAYLTKPAKNDQEKARAIFIWIITNIAWDADRPPPKASEIQVNLILKTKSTTCHGYSMLCETMGKQAGLKMSTVLGWARAPVERTIPGAPIIKLNNGMMWQTHAWNTAILDGKPYLLDTTWGSNRMLLKGKVEPQGTPKLDYFMPPPEALVYTHSPFEPRLQLLKTPVKMGDMADAPRIRPAFFRHGVKLGSAPHVNLPARDTAIVTLEAPADVNLIGGIGTIKSAANAETVFSQVRGQTVTFRLALPKKGVYSFFVSAHKKGQPRDQADMIIEYRVDAEGSKDARAYAKIAQAYYDRHACLYHPLTEQLRADKAQAFAIAVPEATDVWVSTGGKVVALQKRGDLFYGQATLTAGDVVLGARFPGETEATGLVGFVAR